MNDAILDLAIIGGGPAGLSAGLYATRGGLQNVVMYDNGLLGGQITKSSEIENYPGVLGVVSGMELMEKWPEQSMKFGLKHEMIKVSKVDKDNDGLFNLYLEDKKIIKAKAVIVCTGANPKKSNVKGEEEFYGRGVSFCATCDGFFYKNKEVVVLGGGDTAVEEAIFLSNLCSKVYLVHRRSTFRAAPATIQKAKNINNIEFVLDTTVKEIYGDASGVSGVMVTNKEGQDRDLKVLGVFVFVGMHVNNEVLKQENGTFLCDVTSNGEVIVDINMKTSVEGLFAAGDLRVDAAKQVVCAAGDGALAAIRAISYLETLHN